MYCPNCGKPVLHVERIDATSVFVRCEACAFRGLVDRLPKRIVIEPKVVAEIAK